MRRKTFEESNDNADRWLVSYADFITLIFAFFVMMYSVSSVQEKKLLALSQSVGTALGLTANHHTLHESMANPVPQVLTVLTEPVRVSIDPISLVPMPDLLEVMPQQELLRTPQPESPIASEQQAQQEQQSLKRQKQAMNHIARQLEEKLSTLISQGKIHIVQSNWGISIEINASLLFAPAEAQLSHESLHTLRSIADLLKQQTYLIRVEGHTDDKPINTPNFPSNWELSSARATGVVRHLIGLGIDSKRLSAIGYGDTRALADNSKTEGRIRNRRVQLMVFAEDNPENSKDPGLNPASPPL